MPSLSIFRLNDTWDSDSFSADTSTMNSSVSILEDSALSPYVEGELFGRLQGYFVPPHDGVYRFRIRGDDQAILLFGQSEINLVSL